MVGLPSMDELNRRSLANYIRQEHPELGAAEQATALDVAKAAYVGNTPLRDAGEAGVRYVKGRRENGGKS